MARGRRAHGGRGNRMANPSTARSRVARFHGVNGGLTDGTVEVPFSMVVGIKCKGKRSKLNSRRNEMKAQMALKVGISGHGCMEGFYGPITYPATEIENNLLTAIGALALVDLEPAAPVPPALGLDGGQN